MLRLRKTVKVRRQIHEAQSAYVLIDAACKSLVFSNSVKILSKYWYATQLNVSPIVRNIRPVRSSGNG